MEKEYVVLVTNTFDERYSDVYGLYTLDEAMQLLHKIHTDILDEWNDDELYENATMEDKCINDGFFTIDWGDDTYTDYNVMTVRER